MPAASGATAAARSAQASRGLELAGRRVEIVEATAGERPAWDAFVLGKASTLMQAWGWGDLKAAHGWSARRLLAVDRGRVRGAVQVLFRPAPGGVAFGYAPRGPAVADPREDAGTVAALVDAARSVAREHRALVLKMDPEWPVDPGTTGLLRRIGMRDAAYDVQHRRTWMVDIDGDEDRLLGRLRAETRHHVRRGERAGVTVDVSSSPDAVDQYYPLFRATSARKGFVRREREYYRAMVEHLGRSCPVAVLVARVGGEAVSGMIAAAAGPRLCFLFGGSTLRHARLHPTYVLHWAAIRWGRGHGCTTYDMWGVPNDEDPVREGNGYYAFKRRWPGRLVRHQRCQDVPLWRGLGPVPRVVEAAALRGRPLPA